MCMASLRQLSPNYLSKLGELPLPLAMGTTLTFWIPLHCLSYLQWSLGIIEEELPQLGHQCQ